MTDFTRDNPSPKYTELLDLYKSLHINGDPSSNSPAEQTFNGISLTKHIQRIGFLIRNYKAQLIFDYGCGKGHQYKPQNVHAPDGKVYASIPAYWGIKRLHLFDPGVEEFNQRPSQAFEGVICTDVLEHIPREDLPWLIDELFSSATKFVFATIANYPAKKTLPNGENAHCTVEPVSWWQPMIEEIAAKYPTVGYYFLVENRFNDSAGEEQITYDEIEYNLSGLPMV